jgi:hypothetical protein
MFYLGVIPDDIQIYINFVEIRTLKNLLPKL